MEILRPGGELAPHAEGERTGIEVAVVGMAARFPGAGDLAAFWRNLRDGVESIAFFTRDQLLAAGRDPALVDRPDYVPARGELSAADELDAALFNLTPRDAAILNPQHRVFLECAWAALEHAGYDPARVERPVGLFAGSGVNGYLSRLLADGALVNGVGAMRLLLANDKDHLATGTAYRLDLRGPAVAVQTACSTSLVAIHMACQSLVNGECDLALAGGVRIADTRRGGYLYSPDGIDSPDGHCRAFSADARGTVGGDGAGVVVLKKLDDALADGDRIHAVIRGSAINNDGAAKVGYTAPSVAGQARVISEAWSVAAADPATAGYVETHGSGTPLGDAIELRALGEALGSGPGGHPCAIGSVKTNLGHLDAAAGVAGLIKTVLALGHGQIPPSLNCAEPHPEVGALGGRVFVNTVLRPWERNGAPRRAGVSSFGIGGTNAHLVVEEAPPAVPSGPSRPLQLLVVSARTPTALAAAAARLADHLEREAPPLADAACTLQAGRREMEHRLAVVCGDAAEGARALREAAARAAPAIPRGDRPVAFMFPGVGTHYAGMGRGLYDAEPAFRAAVDECRALLRPVLGADLGDLLFAAPSPGPGEEGGDGEQGGGGWDLRRLLAGARDGGEAAPLDATRFAHPAVFVVEYALAKLWMSWGVRPRALIGHSLGEYVAACVAGVLRLDDALRLVALRARLIDALPGGAMLAVPLGEAALREILPGALDLAAVNTPESCVVSGPAAEVEAFERALGERGTVSRRLAARHAFHSRAMEPVAAEVEALAAGFELRAPEIPFVSNLTGGWIGDDEARSPAYWARHLCRTVRFADGVATLRREPGWALLEVGPGQALGAWALQHPAGGASPPTAVLCSLRHQHNRVADLRFVLDALGKAWAAGVAVDWTAFSRGERRHRIPLPGYPFERRRHRVDPPPTRAAAAGETQRRGDGEREREHARADGAGQPQQKGPGGMENRTMAPQAALEPSSRRAAVLGMLKGIAAELTGIDAEQVETGADLFQAGFDSLLLLQAIQAIEKRVGVRVPLVELMEEIVTLGALAEHLDRVLPPDAAIRNGSHAPATGAPSAESAPAPVPALPVFAPAGGATPPPGLVPAPPAFFAPAPAPSGAGEGAGEGVLERLMAQQFQAAGQIISQLAAQQLAAVTGRLAPPAAPAARPADGAAAAENGAAPGEARTGSGAADGAAPRVAARPVAQAPRARIEPVTFVPFQQVSSEGRGGMTERQREYLEDFIARYVERTRASKAHQVRYHHALADTRVTARFRRAWKELLYPIVSPRALGSRVWDLDGNEYVDTGMAFGCALFGHGPEFVTRALHDVAGRGYGVGPQSPDAGRAAELICELGGNERAVFCNSGTEAVMGAIRAARTFSGRNKVAVFSGSYHGWADVVLGRQTPAGVRPTSPGVSPAPLQDVLMLEWDRPESLEILARHLDELAVVMVEPVQSRRLDIHPRAFLHELRRMTSDAGTLLLFDELITGFRVAPGGAQEHFGVRADLVTYGKIVAGGLPMGVVAGRREVMDVFDGGVFHYGDDSYPTAQRTVFAGAFFKHPLSMAVVCAVLEEVRRRGPEMYHRLNERTTRLRERLNAFFEAGGYPVTTAGWSSSFRFFFGAEVQHADLFNHHLIHEGIHVIPETGTHFLSDAHSDDDLDLFFGAVCRSVEAMRRGGFIPEAPGGGDGGGGAISPSSPVRIAPPPASAPPPAAGASPAPSAAAGGPGDGGTAEARVLPASEGQRQLWIEAQMGDAANCAYIESASIRLRGALDVEVLRGALRAVVARHDTLRVTFSADGEWQRVHPTMPVELPIEDLRGAPSGQREAALEAWVRGVVRRPFDLLNGPLFRFDLALLAHDEQVLAFTFHHAALDGQSAGVVWGDLGELYAAAAEGRDPVLPPPADHAALVRAQVRAVQGDDAAQAYWRAQFAGGVPVLELPADRSRPALRSYRGERVRHVVRGELARRLAAAGRPHGLNLFHTFLAAASVWLSRLSGQDDLVIGTPSAGQAAGPERAALVGYAVNVLPLRVRVDAGATFAEHARRVRSGVLHALEHQEFSFPRLVEALRASRDRGRPPLFSVMMNVDREEPAARLGPLEARFRSNFGGGAKLDLVLEIAELPDELRLDLDYATDLFDAATVERWLTAFQRILEQVAEGPSTPLSRISLAGGDERRLVLDEWNRTDRVFPADATIHELFEQQAARTPTAPALEWDEATLAYAELDGRANRLARHLAALGVRAEERVGLLLERGVELVVATLAVMKAGGCCVPVDTSYPPERMALMLEDAGARLLLTRGALADGVGGGALQVVRMDEIADALAAEPDDTVRGGASAGNLAYVFYTSGSTGRPKGVMMGHREIVQLAVCITGCMPMAPGHRVAQASNASFDAAVFETWCALLNGATLVGIDRDVLLSAPALGRALRARRITHLYQTAALFGQHVRERVDVYATLEQLVFGAEAVDTESVRRMLREGRPRRVLHEYGPTEATVWCTLHPVSAVADGAATVPIGLPVPNARAYVLDAALEPLPPAVPGELCVGGAGVVRGYLGRPALTAERFVPDPFAGIPGARMYRTGDRVRWRDGVDAGDEGGRSSAGPRAAGVLEFMGRFDHQVKLRGFRIEPGEVEAALSIVPGVREARVVVREDVPGDRRLVAYVAGEAEVGELRSHLRKTLPEHMVPQAFVRVGHLPLTPNGKLDRAALPAPDAGPEVAGAAPRTPAEEVLAAIWADVLGRGRVGVDEGFFEIGGHSLLAVRVVSRVRDAFGVELPLRALFEGATVAGLARRVEALRGADAPRLPPVVPVERRGQPPLSFAQERLWFLDRLQPGTAFYNIPVPLRLSGALDAAALERALGEIVRRHEALRTTFGEADGGPVQVIAPYGGFALPVEELSAHDDADAAARRRIDEESVRPFDLRAGPLFRATLLRLAADEHVLMLCMHHAVSDGWSMGVLFRELWALYAAYRDGLGSPLAELPLQYADFAAWQRAQLAGDALEGELAWWRRRLEGAPALLELPTDRPRPAVQSYRGAYERFALPAALVERLRALGRREGATLYMVLLGAFQALLARYAGSDDVVVGSPASGRTRGEVEGLVGLFINTLVLRTDLAGDPAFAEVLRRVREATLGAWEHQDVPFEKLVEELRPERSLSHSPLFQVMFTYDEVGGLAAELPGLTLREMAAGADSVKFDLGLGISVHGDAVSGIVMYGTDLFEPATAQRIVGHLRHLLEQVAGEGGAATPLSRLELMDAAERARVVEEWNRTDTPVAPPLVHELVAAHAAGGPDAVAVTAPGEALSYAQLNARANRLARRLARLGVGPESRVGICLPRGAELVTAMLAVWKAGGAWVPLDPTHPPERLRLMLADSAAAVLVTRAGTAPALAVPPGVAVADLGADAGAIAEEAADDPGPAATARSLAYVIYTSGSTGTPKGVAVEHGALRNLCAWHARALGIGASDRASQFISAGFDGSVLEIWPALAAGARVQVVPDEVRADPAALRDFMVREGTTFAASPVSVTEPLLALEWPAGAALRWLVSGADRLRARPRPGAPFTLTNNYGPTECTAIVTSVAVAAQGEGLPGIGRPGDNVRAYVLDAALCPAPVGVPGELYVGGAQVARGYLGRPALTAERFVPDPFAAEPGARLYRTGDRARWRAEGTLDFMGRRDAQVKVRGFRVEPGEVEAALRRHPGVDACAVLDREDPAGGRRLVAYVAGGADAEALREHLRRSLPEHMVPGAFVVLPELPLTPNGKLDRAALPAPEQAGGARHVAPRTAVEAALAHIWAEVLEVERVGMDDGFFELGGHSLLATKVVSRVRAAFGIDLAVRALFEGPTVARLAAAVERARRADGPAEAPVAPVARTATMPVSFGQERLWFLNRLQRGGASYNVHAGLRLSGALDRAALERALGEMVRRHESLRTTFRETDGAAGQVIHPFAGFTLPAEDLSALAAPERDAEAARRASADAARPFDLVAGPLFRATLLRLGGQEHVLLLNVHHAVSDGWSMRVLFRELWAVYDAFRAGRPSPLPEPALQYADFAAWERARAGGAEERGQLAWWKDRLAGAPEALELPADHPRPPTPSLRGGRVPVNVPAPVLERLRELGRGQGATLFVVVLAAFDLLLSRYAGTDDVVVGTPVAGRTRRELEDVFGFFANTLVLRTDLSGDPTFREAVERAKETVLGAQEHQDLPFERLVAELRPERTLSRPALFQVLFQLEEEPDGTAAGGEGLRVRGMGSEGGTANFDLTLVFRADGRELGGTLEYSADLFEPATARRMAGHLVRLLEHAAADPGLPLSALEMMDPAERARMVEEWNRTGAPHGAGRCVHELLAEQAARTPDAPAVVFGDEALTYRELDARANRLAHHLAALGAGPESRVAILLERGTAMVAAIFGVMKSGAAYLPLDAGYPAERLAYMLEDSGAAILVTHSSLRALVPGGRVRVVGVDDDGEAISRHPDHAPRTGVTPANAAYVIYTSGSTGRPKGVVVTHANAASYFAAMDLVDGAAGGTWLAMARTSFDMSVHELLWTLARGCRVVVHPDVAKSGGGAVARAIARHGVTHLVCTPSLMSLVVAESGAEALAGLHRVFIGGEPLPAELAAGITAVLPGGLINMYGPTETTVWATSHPVAPGEERSPIGRPMANVRVYVLDRALRPQPVGVPGELCIGGPGVARGYLGRPALTAERFIPDPYSSIPGTRLYRTGDRARWLASGELEFAGRGDAQVKVRGFRVEPGEIEAALRRHPAVRECAVVVREERPGDRRLAAYAAPAGASADELRAHLRGVLPEYMVPATFTLLEALPRVPSGKLDRRALPPPADAVGGGEPRDYLELRLIQLWEALLGVEGIGPTQSFFDLGGDSFLALHLFARVNRAFGCDLPVATLFAGATVRHMADAVRAQQEGGQAPPEVVALQPEGSLPPLFVIHALDRGVMGYINLVRHLGADQPVYGVRDVGEDLSRPVARIAAEHVAAIRAVQPRGPYSLLGWSFGGTLAYEMAVQLERAGESVAFLGFMDTVSQELTEAWPHTGPLDSAIHTAQEVAERMRRPFAPPDRRELEGLDPGEQVRRVAAALQAQGAAPAGYDAESLAMQCAEVELRARSRRGWEPGPFSGTVTLFRATDMAEHVAAFLAPYTDEEQRTLGWCRHAGGAIEVVEVPGAHVTLGSEPNARILAERLRRALAAAPGRASAAEVAR